MAMVIIVCGTREGDNASVRLSWVTPGRRPAHRQASFHGVEAALATTCCPGVTCCTYIGIHALY